MAARTIIHIGLPKTGTTYLQTAMWSHRRQLHERGWLYPGADRMQHFHLARVVAGHSAPKSERLHRELLAETRAWDGTALLSHEFLCRATTAQASQLVEDLGGSEVNVVVSARDYGRQLAAVWQEALKMGSARGLGEFMDRMLAPGHREEVRQAHQRDSVGEPALRRAWGWATQDLGAVVQRWSEAVGPAQVRVVTVPQPGSPPSLLWDRWCAASGLDDSDLDLTTARANESLGAVQAALLTHVVPELTEEFDSATVRHRWLRQYLGHKVLVPQAGERIGIPDRYADQVAVLADGAITEVRAMGCDVVGDLEELRPAHRPYLRDPDTVTEAEALAAAAKAMEHMVRDVRRLTYKARAARAEAAPPPPSPTRARQLASWVRRHARRDIAGSAS